MQTKTRHFTFLAFIICVVLSAPAVAQWQLTGNRDASATSQIGTTNNFPLKLSTNNLPRMIIDVTGKVGVGTLVPTSALHVAGQVKIVDGTQGAGKVLTSDANGLSSWLLPASSPWTISSNNIFSTNTGNVGIGLTTPLYKLDVSGDIRVNGLRIGKGNSSIVDNTAFGMATLDANTTGTGNTAYGYYALYLNKIGLRNTAIGSYALSKDTANENTAIGARALQNNISGKNNTATGANALYANTTGYNNSATGDSALYANTTGYGNIAAGREAMKSNTTGFNNTAIGHQALIINTIGTTNTAIGFGADVLAGTYTNATAIGANAKVGASNSLVLGSGASVGIGTATPAARLDVVGTVKFTDGTQSLGKVLTSDAAGKASWQIAPGSLWTLSGANASYSQAGSIGIGTTTPGAKLEVNNTIKFTNASSDANDGIIGTAPFNPGLNIVGINTDDVRRIALYGSITQYGNGDFNSFEGKNYFNGNVGIGTAQPLESLDVNGNLNFSSADVPVNIINQVGGNTPVMNLGVNFLGSNVNQAYRGAAYTIDTRDNSPLHSWYSRPANTGSNNRVMSLWGNGGLSIGSSFTNYTAPADGAIFQGNVGVGNNAPANKLSVTGNADFTGNVGIGTSTPTQKLDIKGNLIFSGATVPTSITHNVGGNTPVMSIGVNAAGSGLNLAYSGLAYELDPRNGPRFNWFTRSANTSQFIRTMSLWENGGLCIGSTYSYNTPPIRELLFQATSLLVKTIMVLKD